METVEIYISEVSAALPSKLLEAYLTVLPVKEQDRNKRFLRWEDQHAHLFGKLLIRNALMKCGYAGDVLHLLQHTEHQKPFLNDTVHFNISHSGKFVVCAVSTTIRLGIDIEKTTPLPDLADFKDLFTAAEWDHLNADDDKAAVFFKLWTRKESIIKANGQGLALPLHQVSVLNETVFVENERWFIRDLDLETDYHGSLATSIKDFSLHLTPLSFY